MEINLDILKFVTFAIITIGVTYMSFNLEKENKNK